MIMFFAVFSLYFSGDARKTNAATEISPIDIGLRMNIGTEQVPNVVKVLVEPEGVLTSPLRIYKGGKTYGIIIADPNDPNLK